MTVASPKSFGRRRLTLAWCGLLLLGIAGFVLTQAWSRSPNRADIEARPNCAAWDREASEGIAALISDTSAAAELRLDEAILQLRRARKNCRAGFIELAGHDYTSLHRAFPFSTASTRAYPQDDAAASQPPKLSR